MSEKATVGRVVHFVMENGAHRPAIVVQPWGNGDFANLQVFLDGTNDCINNMPLEACMHGIMWATSVTYSENKEARTWHWPERE